MCTITKKLVFMLLNILFIIECNCATYPIAPAICTTRTKLIVPNKPPKGKPKILFHEFSKYKENGYGTWHYGKGKNYVRRLDLMPADYHRTTQQADILLHFFAITDIHITDKESPAQAIFLGYTGESPSAYSGVMLYTTHVLDAAIQTINAHHKKKPFDFGISLGDTCNSTQLNELRWYIDVIDGKIITPGTGGTLDYQKTYKAAGLDKTIKWYQVLGNHDHFWMGFLPPNDYIKRHMIGKTIINLGNPFTDPRGADSRGFYMGSIDGTTPYGNVIGAGLVQDFKVPPTIRSSDATRRSLSRKEWIGEFFKSSTRPTGHGFKQINKETGFACYAFQPKPNVPIKVIVLDDTQRDDNPNDPESLGYGHGSLDDDRYNWLVSELDKGQAEGKLMIIAAHIPIGVEPAGSMMAWNKQLEKKLLAKLHTYPNLILWIAGHRHQNTITAFKSPDPKRPELGFWQVETASLRDFPQQFRAFQIVRNNDNTISIFATNIDPAVKEGSPAAISRSYAIATRQLSPVYDQTHKDLDSYNVELLKQL